MKKSLVALAVLAASGASFAQVSVTGQVSMGWKGTHSNTGTTGTGIIVGSDSSGLGVDTANLYFTSKEDLGGGQKIEAKLGFDTVTRGAAGVVGGDTVLTYTNNSFGQIELGATKGDDVFTGIAYGGANLITFDSKLNQIETSSDYIRYAAKFGDMIVAFKHSEPSSGLGLGSGTQGATTTTTQGTNDFVLAYMKGPLNLVGAYRNYTNQDEIGGIFDGNSLTKKSVVHAEAGYDFGAVKVGAGFDHADVNWGITQDNVIVGASLPVGAWTFGGAWESSKVSGAMNAPLAAFGGASNPFGSAAVAQAVMQVVDGTATGVTLGAQYNFSKSANLAIRYASWTRSGYEQLESNAFGYKPTETQTDILLTKTF